MEVLVASTQEISDKLCKSPSRTWEKTKLDLLEIYCMDNSRMTTVARQMGLKAMRFTKNMGDLQSEQGKKALWRILETCKPDHVWMAPECGPWGNFSRLNLCRGENTRAKILSDRKVQRQYLELCNEVYNYQTRHGQHFYMEQPQGSEVFEQEEVADITRGTLCSVFDMCEVGKLRMPKGNNFLRKRSVVRTTSRELHESLDARYCNRRHKHQPIEGKIRYLGRWINLSEYAARYSQGFVKNICWYLMWSKSNKDWPLDWVDLCFNEREIPAEQLILANHIKTRRCSARPARKVTSQEHVEEQKLIHKNPRRTRLEKLFQGIEERAPRVGTVVLDLGESLVQEIRGLWSTLDIRGAEICRGTDRFRLPKGQYDQT